MKIPLSNERNSHIISHHEVNCSKSIPWFTWKSRWNEQVHHLWDVHFIFFYTIHIKIIFNSSCIWLLKILVNIKRNICIRCMWNTVFLAQKQLLNWNAPITEIVQIWDGNTFCTFAVPSWGLESLSFHCNLSSIGHPRCRSAVTHF